LRLFRMLPYASNSFNVPLMGLLPVFLFQELPQTAVHSPIAIGPTSSSTTPPHANPNAFLHTYSRSRSQSIASVHNFNKREIVRRDALPASGLPHIRKEARLTRVLEDCHSYHPQPHLGHDRLSYTAIALTTEDVFILHPRSAWAVNSLTQNVAVFTV
jgi:hypothetical protein